MQRKIKYIFKMIQKKYSKNMNKKIRRFDFHKEIRKLDFHDKMYGIMMETGIKDNDVAIRGCEP